MDLQNMSPEEIAELQKKNCIFCKIIHGDIPSHEVYSDDKVKVILDINPVHEGHCLILPKQHYQILPQIPDDLIAHMFLIAKRTSRLLLKALGIKGTTTFVANGAIAGQKSPHFMIHVIPRKKGDMLFKMPKKDVDEEKLAKLHNDLAVKLGGKPMQQAEKIEKPPEAKEKIEEVQSPESKDIDLDKISDLLK